MNHSDDARRAAEQARRDYDEANRQNQAREAQLRAEREAREMELRVLRRAEEAQKAEQQRLEHARKEQIYRDMRGGR